MHYNSVEFLPSYPSLELGENTSRDICHLATEIIGSSTANAAILQLPRNLKTFLDPHFKSFQIEKLIWEHVSNNSNKLLILEDGIEGSDILADIETISTYSPLLIIVSTLHDSDGGILGFMCIYDTCPVKITNSQEQSIKILSHQAALLGLLKNPKGLIENQGAFVDNKRFTTGNFLESNNSLLWRLNGISGNLWCNELFLDILGYSPYEFHFDSFSKWLDLVYSFDQDRVNTKFQAWLENNLMDEELECRLLHKSGDIVFVTIRVLNTSYGKNGSVYQIEGDVQNITSQKKVWEQIEFIHPKYTSVIQAGYDWLSIVDLKGNYTYINPTWESALGYCSDELIGKNIFNNVHGSDQKMVDYYFSKFIKNEPFVSKPFRFKHKNGSWKWLEILMVNLNDDPMIQGIVINARDITDRVMTYQEIKASEEKHRLLFTSSPYPKYILELESCKIVDVNDAMIAFYGYSRAELLEMNAKDLRPEEEIDALLKGLEMFLSKTRSLCSGIYIHKKRNGELVKMEVVGQPICLDGVRCALATCTDVTEREEYLNKLKHSENKLKSATTIAKLGYWSIDLKDMSLNCSEEVYRIWERDMDTFQLNYESFIDSLHPHDREQFRKENERAISQSLKYDHVYRIITPNNSIKWVRHLCQPKLIINGIPFRLEGTVQDITQQKMEEHRLKLLESVVTNARDAVLITEAEPINGPAGPRILYVNEAFTKMTGYQAREVIGRTPRMLQGPKSDRAELKRLKSALRRSEPCEITIVNYKKNGEEFWANFSISPVADEKGCFTHWISIERDVTVEKNQELLNNLMIDISLIFGNEKYLWQCLKSVLDYFVDIGGFTLAEIWLPKSENFELKTFNGYSIVRMDAQYHKHSEEEESQEYLGKLVNSIREKQCFEVWDIGKQSNPLKKEILKAMEMECVMGIPLFHHNKFKGVLILGAENEINSQLYRSEPFREVANHLAAEIKRKHIETELEHVFNFAPDILCKVGKDGFFKKINPAASKLLGYSEEELLSKKIIEFVHPEDREKTKNKQLFLYTGKSFKQFENRYLSKNGETIWLSWTARSNQEEDAIFAVAKDVTENRELKGILNEVTDLALIGTWELSFNHSTIYWSDMVKKIHEVDSNYAPTIESVLGFFRDGKTRERILQEINNAIYKGEPWDLELPIITAKGNERWVRMIGKPEFAFDKCFRIIGSIQDINDLKTAELKMQQANNDKNNILESIGDAFISLDHEWTITYWNEKAKKLLGVDREYTIGKNFWDFKWNNINVKDYLKYYRKIKSGSMMYLEEYVPALNKWLEISAYPSERTISLYIKDITEKRQIQIAVEKQNQKLREIAWTQSHLVRAPLARLMGVIDLFHEDLVADGEKKQMLGHIYSSAIELDTIIKEIVSKSQSVISNE